MSDRTYLFFAQGAKAKRWVCQRASETSIKEVGARPECVKDGGKKNLVKMKKKLIGCFLTSMFFGIAMLIGINTYATDTTCNFGVSLVQTSWWPPSNDKVTKFCDCSTTPEFEEILGICKSAGKE